MFCCCCGREISMNKDNNNNRHRKRGTRRARARARCRTRSCLGSLLTGRTGALIYFATLAVPGARRQSLAGRFTCRPAVRRPIRRRTRKNCARFTLLGPVWRRQQIASGQLSCLSGMRANTGQLAGARQNPAPPA